MTTLVLRALTKRFGSLRAVDDVSFSVEGGSVTGFLGANGAGKTTTLRMLLGLVAPTAGKATIDGTAYPDLRHPHRQVGAVLEATGFHPGRRAADHLRVLAAAGGTGSGRVDEVLDQVGLSGSGDRRVGEFSLGMRQRLGLAAALLADPGALVLDEPANGLDPDGSRWLRSLLRRLADEGRAVLVSSHNLHEVTQFADRIVILRDGRIAAHGSLAELTASDADLEELYFRVTSDEGSEANR
jgi:ABC-2 type transport system ATP-binding protein